MQLAFLMIISLLRLLPSFTSSVPFVEVSQSTKFTAIEIDAVLDRCCAFGAKEASYSSYSLKISSVLSEISKELHGLCRANVETCREKTNQEANCKAGKNHGKLKRNCNERKRSEMFQLCCNACKVGQQIALIGISCDSSALDAVVDQVKNDCCLDFEMLGNIDENDDEDDEESEYSIETTCDDNHACEQTCYILGNQAFCDCNEGFKLAKDGSSCIPIGAELNLAGAELNQVGSETVCEKGLKDNGRGDCEDIDECELETNGCNKFEKCVNTVGSFVCETKKFCPSGFVFNHEKMICEDIDECSQGSRCSRIEVCLNTPGSFNCKERKCVSGYKLDRNTGECKDNNECLTYDCGKNRKCLNSLGSFNCVCNEGYKKDRNFSQTCRDIDECIEDPGICDQDCRNSVGSFKCGCKRGYTLNDNKRTCNDIDECKRSGELLCQSSHCQNTVGSYKCDCPSGYRLLNQRCLDIDECSKPKKYCRENQYCMNMQGSYQCINRTCDSGYRYKDELCHLMDRTLCFENNDEVRGKCRVPRVYGFTFGRILHNINFVDNGQVLYHLNISKNLHCFSVEMKDFKSIPKSRYFQPVNESTFSFEIKPGKIIYKLMKPIEGPQDIHMRIWITCHQNEREFLLGQNIFIVVEKPEQFS